LAADEVLVQTVDADRRAMVLQPCNLADLRRSDVLHASQTVDPADTGLSDYAAAPRADNCNSYRRPDGTTGHLYSS
jgi:hypothetical protein